MAAEGQSNKMASDMEVHVEQRCITESLQVEKIAPTDIYQHLLNICGDQTVNMSTAKQRVVCFTSGNSDSGSPLVVEIFTSMAFRLLFTAGKNAELMVVTMLKK